MTESAEGKYALQRLAGDADLQRWDSFVAASPQANPFSTRCWIESAGDSVGAASEFWIASKGESWHACLPLTSRRAGGRWHLGLPFASYNTISYRAREDTVHPSSVTAEQLEVTEALIAGTRGRLKNWDLMLSPAVTDVRPWTWAGWAARPRYTYVLDLTKPLQVTHAVRKHVRKCHDAGMTFDTKWDLDALCSVFDATRERQRFDVRLTMERFRALCERLHQGGLATMGVARDAGGETAAAHILLSIPGAKGTFHWAIGTHARYLTSGVSSWLMVETAAEMSKRGLHTWDLCGADFPSIARFKSNLGGSLVAYFQVHAPRGAVESIYGSLKGSWRALTKPGGAPRR